jgi:predicted HTH domain antitoxin
MKAPRILPSAGSGCCFGGGGAPPGTISIEETMTRLKIALPDIILSTLGQTPQQMEHELPLAAAIHWYQQGLISMERAAEVASLSRPEFLAELARRKVDVFVVDIKDLRQELAVSEGAALEARIKPQRLGFLAGEIAVPDDFNTMGQTEIGDPLGENPG